MGNWFERFEKAIAKVSRILNTIGMGFLFLLMLLITADVLFRAILKSPILGANELAQFMMLMVVYLAMGYTQHQKGHVSVDLLVSRFSQYKRNVLNALMYLLSLFISGLMLKQSFAYHQILSETHKLTSVLKIPIAPFQIVLIVGVGMLCLALLMDVIHALQGLKKR